MKRPTILVMLLLATTLRGGQTGAGRTVTVHVNASRLQNEKGEYLETLDVTISGKHYELSTFINPPQVLVPGDYQAKIVKSGKTAAYLMEATYELQYPDGKSQPFKLTGAFE